MIDELHAEIERLTHLTIEAADDTSHPCKLSATYAVELARWLLTRNPIHDLDTRTIRYEPSLEQWHIDLTLESARRYHLCHQVYTFLNKAWPNNPQTDNEYWHDSNGRSAHHTSENCAASIEDAHCECGCQCDRDCWQCHMVETSHGHRFMGTDSPHQESCLNCGGTWEIIPVPGSHHMGRYVASNGDPANECTGGHSDLVHGCERVCQDNNGRECATAERLGTCPHTEHNCNCVQCQ